MRRALLAATVLVLPAGVAVLLLAATGALSPSPIAGLPDPGALTRYGLPISQALRDLSAMVTVGALVLVACCLPPAELAGRTELDQVVGARRRVLDLAGAAAALWTWSSLTLLAFTYSDIDGTSVTSPGSLTQMVYFARSFDLGRYLLSTASLAAVIAVWALVGRRIASVGVLAVLAVAALWPVALAGHAADSLGHEDSVNLQAMHLVGVGVWFGGLVALVVARRSLGDQAVAVVQRYSTLAGFCLALVAVAGAGGALLRVPTLDAAWSSYGALLVLKIGAVLLLSGFGWWQRRRLIERMRRGRPEAFWQIAVLELLVLAAAAGTAVALSRTYPPASPGGDAPLTTAEALLGYEMPRALGASEWFTQWRPDLFFLPLTALALACYGWGVLKLRARGDRWPWWQTLSWVVGCLLLAWATNGSPGAYSRVLFSMHMVQHMTVATAVPVFLVLGAPVTLALRACTRRTDGSMGPREWLLRVVHSAPAYLLGHPIVASAIFIVSLVAFYSSSLFELSLRTHTGHVLMVLHFLLSGYLLASCLVGLDPGPRRPPFPLRALILMITFGAHALYSVTLMASNQVLAADWFDALGRTWGSSSLEDQYLGASLGWALGDYPLAILGGALVVLWVRSDQRERRRFDRKAARDGDAEMTAYNEYLRSLRSRR